jgi:hypothetical protein
MKPTEPAMLDDGWFHPLPNRDAYRALIDGKEVIVTGREIEALRRGVAVQEVRVELCTDPACACRVAR